MFKKENWFKWLFKKEHEELHKFNSKVDSSVFSLQKKVEELENVISKLQKRSDTLSFIEKNVLGLEDGEDVVRYIKQILEWTPTEEAYFEHCIETLGIPFIKFSEVDNEGKPPHYLADLNDVARKDFIAHMESIYNDEKVKTVLSYVINLIGNHSMQKADDDKMRNGKIAIIGIRTLWSEYIQAHQEYVDSKKPVEGFDKLAILPE